MFTLAQIDDLHDRLGNADTFFEYVQGLKALGVEKYESYVADGHSEYFGAQDEKLITLPAHDYMPVADTSSKEDFLKHLKLHEQGVTTYLEMSRGLAASGIEKWTVDTRAMTMIFYDKAGSEMLVENIEAPVEE